MGKNGLWIFYLLSVCNSDACALSNIFHKVFNYSHIENESPMLLILYNFGYSPLDGSSADGPLLFF